MSFRLFLLLSCGPVMFCGCGNNSPADQPEAVRKTLHLSIAGVFPVQGGGSVPSVGENSLFLADGSGGLCRLDCDLREIWRVSPFAPDERFRNSGVTLGGMLYVGSMAGNLYCLKQADGAVLWKKSYDADFAHVPAVGTINNRTVLWMLSSSDGVIFCIDAASGELLWKGEETNRSDGGAVVWSDIVVYGNCDGAAHLFNAADGRKIASVPVGDADQMAGTPLVTEDGRAYIGTRGGKIAVIDIRQEKLISTLSVSEEEAFTTPVQAFDGLIAMGTGEGEVLLCGMQEGQFAVVRRHKTDAPVGCLAFCDDLLYALSGGTLVAFNASLEVESSLNVADSAEGFTAIPEGRLFVRGDNALIGIRGVWR